MKGLYSLFYLDFSSISAIGSGSLDLENPMLTNSSSQGVNRLIGFRAGRFLHGSIPPPETNDIEFGKLCNIHLRPLKEPSPFVSVFDNLRPALSRALRSSGNAHVAVINIDYLSNMRIAGSEVLFRAGPLVKKYEIMGHSYETNKDYHYRASSE